MQAPTPFDSAARIFASIVIASTVALVACNVSASPPDDPGVSNLTESALVDILERKKRIPSAEKRGIIRHWHACRTAPGGCVEHLGMMVGYIFDAASDYNVDPYVLTGMAWSESRFNAYAEGKAGELGVFQIHPSNRKGVQFLAGNRTGVQYRELCRRMTGQCQLEVTLHAAGILSRAIEKCGSLEMGLSAYNTGRCESTGGAKYARRVIRLADEFGASAVQVEQEKNP